MFTRIYHSLKKTVCALGIITLFFASTSIVFAEPKLDFKSSKPIVAPNQNWKLLGTASGVAGCFVEGSFDSALSGENQGWYPPNFETGVIDDSGEENYTYKATCFTEIVYDAVGPFGVGDTTYSISKPLPNFITDGFTGARITGSGAEITKSVTVTVKDSSASICDEYPDSAACILCTNSTNSPNNSESPQCKNCATATANGNGDPGNEPTCACATNPENAVCSLEDEEDVDTASGNGVKEECGIGNISKCIKDAITTLIDTVFVNLAALFLALCAYVFEYVIYFSIVKIAAIAGSPFILEIWTIIRDVLNITVIFILLYLAIRIIIGQNESVKKIIAGVIVFGVLTNFSLFLTKAAIDISNVITLEFYQNLRLNKLTEVKVTEGGIASTILSKTKVNTFFSSKLTNPQGEISGENQIAAASNVSTGVLGNSWLYRFVLIITLFALGLIFLQAAFMFIFRLLALLLIMIFSPLMFAGGLFTPLKSKIDEWWGAFTSQILFAPIFFILLYVGVFIMGGMVSMFDSGGTLGLTGASGENSFFPTVVSVLIVNILIIVGFSKILEVSKSFSTDWGNASASWASKKVGGMLGGITGAGFGGMARTLRYGAKLANVDTFSKNVADSNSFFKGTLGRAIGLDKLNNKTFDIRNSKYAQKAGSGVLGALNSASGGATAGFNLGEGSKTTLSEQKGIKETYDQIRTDFQTAANKRAESRLSRKLESIGDDATTDYDIINNTLETRKWQENEETGEWESIVSETIKRGSENDKDWAKKVKEVNNFNKRYQQEGKKRFVENYANKAPANTLEEVDRKRFILSSNKIARFRAVEKQLKSSKESTAGKLEQYTDDLVKLAKEVDLPVTETAIRDASDDDRLIYFKDIADALPAKITDLKTKIAATDTTTDQGKEDRKKLEGKLFDAQKNLKKAKDAEKKIGELKKKLEKEKEDKKDKK